VTAAEDLEALQWIAERSPEGAGVPLDTLDDTRVRGSLHILFSEGLIEHAGEKDTVAITDAGWDVLRPHNSL
jgi:hypothetical protein